MSPHCDTKQTTNLEQQRANDDESEQHKVGDRGALARARRAYARRVLLAPRSTDAAQRAAVPRHAQRGARLRQCDAG